MPKYETRGKKPKSKLEIAYDNEVFKISSKAKREKRLTSRVSQEIQSDKKKASKAIKWKQVDIVRQRYYTTAEIMTMLSFSRHTVYSYAENKVIPNAVKIGGHWRFPVFDFERWLEHTHEIYRSNRYKKEHLLEGDEALKAIRDMSKDG